MDWGSKRIEGPREETGEEGGEGEGGREAGG